MARRRRQEEEHDNHERWLVSYADFITLLFAFFVVMYSLSSVNEGKYRVLSDSMVQAFRNVTVNESGEQIVLPTTSIIPTRPITQPGPPASENVVEQRRREVARQMRDMADEIRRVLSPLTQSGQVKVTEGAFGVSVAGYADQRPVAGNDSEDGRGRNRRVTVLIESRTADLEPEPGPTSIPTDDPIRSILPDTLEG